MSDIKKSLRDGLKAMLERLLSKADKVRGDPNKLMGMEEYESNGETHCASCRKPHVAGQPVLAAGQQPHHPEFCSPQCAMRGGKSDAEKFADSVVAREKTGLKQSELNFNKSLSKADSIQESYSQAEGPPRKENAPPAVAPMDFKAPPKAKVELPQWQGRAISHPDHVTHLEQAAALNEFHHKMPREMAEEKAHRDYRLEQHSRAAAHHLQGMKAAQGSGDMDSARKHGAMYDMHIRQLGHEPVGPVPDAVRAHLDHPDRESVYKFKPHKGDIFLAQG